jgi:hypothetical protein
MSIKQLSIFLENKSGRLTEVLETLGQKKINIAAMSIADTSEYGILRLIVSDPEEALKLLKAKEFSVNMTDVIAIETPTYAGAFAEALRHFSDAQVGIEYMYAFELDKNGIIVMRTDDRQKAFKIIESKKLRLVSGNDVFKEKK